MITEGLAIAAATTIIGGIVWGVRLEGRVNTSEKLTDQKHEDMKELMTVRFDGVSDRLERIEKALNGALHKG